jgi:hypothetical protein
MSPEEWLKSQASQSKPNEPLSPEEWLKSQPKQQVSAPPIAPTTQPTGEPTAAELEAASKPAFMTKQQVMGNAAPRLEAIRSQAASTKPAPELKAEKPFTPPDRTAFKEALTTIEPKRVGQAFPVMTESDKLFGPMPKPKQPMGGRATESIVDNAAKNPAIVDVAAEYLRVRQPNLPTPKTGTPEDNKKTIDRFRKSFVRGDIATVNELTWAMNATPEQKEVARNAYELADKIGTPLGAELMTALNPLESPLTYASLGAGWAAKQMAVRGVSTAAKMALKPSTVTGIVEGGVAAATNITEQKTQVELGIKNEISYAELAITTGISAGLGKVGSLELDTAKKGFAQPVAERMEDLRKAKGQTPVEMSKKDREWLDAYTSREKEVVEGLRKEAPSLFEDAETKKAIREGTLDKMSPQTVATKAVLNDKTLADIYNVTKELFKANPELRPNLQETRVTQGMIDALSKASPDDIQGAASRAGVSPTDFLETFKVSLSDAGQVLQKSSDMAKFLQKLSVADPALEEAVNNLYKQTSGVQYWTDKAAQFVSKGTGASVGLSTTAPSTAIVNAFSAAFTVALKTAGDVVIEGVIKPLEKAATKKTKGVSIGQAADILDEVVLNTGRMTNDLSGAVIPLTKDRVKADMGEIVGNSFHLVTKMLDGGWTGELTDQMLKDSPRIKNMLLHVGAESDNRGLPSVVNQLNALNIAVDAMVRKPAFVDAASQRMRDIGLDYEEFVATGRPIPSKIQELAGDDAMKMTFSYNFKTKAELGETGFEATMEDAAAKVLRAAQDNVYFKIGKDLGVPFLRYQLNAVRYAYRLTPASGVGGVLELRQAAKLRSQGKDVEAALVSYDGRRKLVDSTIGLGAMMAIAATRDGTVSSTQYRDQDGDVKDMSNLAPFVQLAVMSDLGKLMIDMGKKFWYTISMTPEERMKEGEKFKEQALKLDKNDPDRQDLIDQYELMAQGRFRNVDGVKALEILTGMGRQAGVQQTMIDKVRETLEEGLRESSLKGAAYTAGQFASRFDNVMNPLYDAINALRDDMRIVESKGESTFTGQLGEVGGSFVAPILSNVPGAKEGFQDKPRALTPDSESPRVPTVSRQVLGLKPELPTSPTENELVRLGIEPFRVYKTTGNRDFDNLHITETKKVLDLFLKAEINSPVYQKKTMTQQEEAINKKIKEAYELTRPIADAKFQNKSPDKAIDMAFDKMPKAVKASAVDEFRNRNQGREPETIKDKMSILTGAYNVNFAKGGLVSQMDKLLTNSRQ